MRFVVYGAGAIGGVVGGRLAAARARGGAHRARRPPRRDPRRRPAARRPRTRRPVTLSIPVVSHPAGIDFRDDDVVLLAMKSQHTGKALSALAAAAPDDASRWCACRTASPTSRAALRLLRGRVRRVRGVPRAAPRAGRGRGARGAAHRHPRHRSVPARDRTRAAEAIAAAFDVVDVRVGGAARHHAVEVRQAPQQPRQRGRRAVRSRPRGARRCTGGRGTRAPRCLAAAGIDAVDPRGGRRPPRRPLPVGWRRRPLPPGRVVVAEPGPGHRVDRGRLPQRRDRAAGPAPRRAHPGEPAAAAAGGRRRPRGSPPRHACRSTS